MMDWKDDIERLFGEKYWIELLSGDRRWRAEQLFEREKSLMNTYDERVEYYRQIEKQAEKHQKERSLHIDSRFAAITENWTKPDIGLEYIELDGINGKIFDTQRKLLDLLAEEIYYLRKEIRMIKGI